MNFLKLIAVFFIVIIIDLLSPAPSSAYYYSCGGTGRECCAQVWECLDAGGDSCVKGDPGCICTYVPDSNNCYTQDCVIEGTTCNANPCNVDTIQTVAPNCSTSCVPQTPDSCTCPVTCGGGTEVCSNDCYTWDGAACNTQSCCTPNCTGKTCGDDGCGGSCGTCAVGDFCVVDNCCTPTAPSAVNLASPANGTVFNGVSSTTLDWDPVASWGQECSGVSGRDYTVCVGTNASDPCTSPLYTTVVDEFTTSISYTWSINTTLYWNVTATNKRDVASYSPIWSFTFSNDPPTLPPSPNYVTPLEFPNTGSVTLFFTPSDPDGASDLDSVYLAMNNCTSLSGEAAWSNFEHNLANWFGGLWRSYATGKALINNAPLSSCASGSPSPNTVNPWSYTLPQTNALSNLTLNSITSIASGNNLTTSWNLMLTNFPVGLHYTYTMIRDKEYLWHTYPDPASWTRLNQVCAEGGPYIVDNSGSVCGNSEITCTQDCISTDNCVGYPQNACTECFAVTELPDWSAWSTCNSSHIRTRTRACSEYCSTDGLNCTEYFSNPDNCPVAGECSFVQTGLSATQTQTQDCLGSVSGTLFDASDVGSCLAMTTTINGAGTGIFFNPSANTNPMSIPVGSDGTYSFMADSPGTYSPDFQSLVDAGIIASTTPKISCNGASVTFSGSPTDCLTQPCEAVTNQNYGFFRIYNGWWQAEGGPVYAGAASGESVQSIIPASLPDVSDMYLIKPISNHKGFLMYGSVYDLGSNPDARINAANASIQGTNDSSVIYNYSFFSNKLSQTPSDVIWNSANLPDYNDAAGKGFMIIKYTGASGTLNIAAKSILANQKYVVLIPSGVSVNITGNITVANSGFLALISSGSINFEASVTTADGWYLSDGVISIATTANTDTEQQFVGTGSFVGHSGIFLTRDLGIGNNSTPAELFSYSVDQLIAAPSIIKFPYRKFTPYSP